MPSLDVDELLDALEPPTLTIRGEVYTGRHPGFVERLQIEGEWEATEWGNAQAEKQFLEKVCEVVGIPVAPLLDLPEAVLSEVVLFFLAISRGANLDGEIAEMEAETETPAESTEESPTTSESSD